MSDYWTSSQPVWTEGGAILLLPLLVLLLLFLWMMLWFQGTSLRNEQSCCVVNINRKEENSRSRPFVDPSELISVSLQSPWQQGNNVEEERRGVVTNRVVCACSEIESGERGEKRSRDEAVIFAFVFLRSNMCLRLVMLFLCLSQTQLAEVWVQQQTGELRCLFHASSLMLLFCLILSQRCLSLQVIFLWQLLHIYI